MIKKDFKVKYFYTYEIYINNPESSLYGCYYYGKHETNNLADDYYGSGKVIRTYIKRHGYSGLEKRILKFCKDRNELLREEWSLIEDKRKQLGKKCLNMYEGGTGGHWVEYVTLEEYEMRVKKSRERQLECTTPEQRSAIAKKAADSKKNATPEQRARWGENMKRGHANQTPEQKASRYNKVSSKLKEWYKTANADSIRDRNLKNKVTNQETSKKWRSQFLDLFGCTVETFRKYGKMKEALSLFKELLNGNLDVAMQKDIAKKFKEETFRAPITYISTVTEATRRKLEEHQENRRQSCATFIYFLDEKVFYGEAPLIEYIRRQYNYKVSRKGIAAILNNTSRAKTLYPQLLGKIQQTINLKKDVKI